MNDPVALLRERVAKAEAKLARAEKSVESARTELTEYQTALRVMEGLMGESTSSVAPAASSTALRQSHILGLLSERPTGAKSPADLFSEYELVGSETISLDTFRTTIWRMADNATPLDTQDGKYVVKRGGNGYWKEKVRVIDVPNPDAPPPPAPAPRAVVSSWEDDDDFDSLSSARAVSGGGFADDPDDSDIPF